MPDDFTAAVKKLSEEYRDLNGDTIEVLDAPPSAIEFARLVHISRPVVIRGRYLNQTLAKARFNCPALHLWSDEYLIGKMGERLVSVAATPNGCADAITPGSDGRLYFVEPAVDQMTMGELLSDLNQKAHGDIHYLQSQNGNLFSPGSFNEPSESSSEFAPLIPDVPQEIPWCSEALGQPPDAVNIWIGDERSVTSIHSDPYENIYTVMRGRKDFLLLPPSDSWCLEERTYPHATYSRNAMGNFEVSPSGDVPDVRWSSIIDPRKQGALPSEVQPMRVTLLPGDTLYLPVGWWHYVSQKELTIALNWWYDAELRGMTWVLLNYLRNPQSIPRGDN